ncbi:hypothetical protein EJC51_00530 [Streptomyces aquilus]|uniref:Uncharacterized protein n=1 Tax=Streptomyces aquilus TaxID=2548456 RepID=A0A3Q9BUM9_9ACTN|nr:hypothetical protein [Streptomyces aquilus]AZP14782.1 hypothetical protein EJC51_00530 [Streptomyces aquilus]
MVTTPHTEALLETRLQQTLDQMSDESLARLAQTLQTVAHYAEDSRRQVTRTLASPELTAALAQIAGAVERFRNVSEPQLAAAAAVLMQAYPPAPCDDVPDELRAELDETLREFSTTDAALLSPDAARTVFVCFCGLLAVLALIQVSLTSPTADFLFGKVSEYEPYGTAAMAAAAVAWDRVHRRPQDDEEDGD